MRVEWYGGPKDGATFTVDEDAKGVEWFEPVFDDTGKRVIGLDVYRAPIAPEFRNGKPTGKALVFYRYRSLVDQ